jgi:hypothetical protein
MAQCDDHRLAEPRAPARQSGGMSDSVNQREDTVEAAAVMILVVIGLLYGIWRSIGGKSEQKMTPSGNVQNRTPAGNVQNRTLAPSVQNRTPAGNLQNRIPSPTVQNRTAASNVQNKRPTATVGPEYYAKIRNLESRWRTINAFSADHGETELGEAIRKFYGDREKALEYIIERRALENRSWR